MIDAVQRFLAKHRRWLFACLLAVVVVPFVFTVGATPGCVGGKRQRDKLFFGINVASPREVEDLQRATAFSLHFSNFSENVPLDSAMMARAAWLWIAGKLQIPDPSEDELRNFIRSRPAFFDESGNFSEERYGDFFGALREQAPEFEQFIAHTLADDWRIGVAAGTLSAANFSLPSEAMLRARQLNTEWKLSGATLRFADFHPAIDVSESDLEAFFNGHRELFKTPLQVIFDNAVFPKQFGELGAEDGEQLLAYLRGEGVDGAKPEAVAAAAEQVAMARAGEFLYRLYGFDELPDDGEISALAEELGAKICGPDLATSNGTGESESITENIRRAAMELDDGNHFSRPLSESDAVRVLILRRRVESRNQPFWEVRTAVEQCYRRQKQVDLFLNHASETRNKLLSKLSAGESFPDAAKVLGLEVQKPISLTLKNLPKEVPAEWAGAFLRLNSSELGDFLLISKPDLQIWFVDDKKVPTDGSILDEAKTIEMDYANGSGQLFMRQIVEELIMEEMKKL
ncbi:MAG: SurA N-terminal domain-containing protein [Puniceicoccales bacterium]|nr:SurA N-terminal domain-containing protein [Puniceicoccales bacterium]